MRKRFVVTLYIYNINSMFPERPSTINAITMLLIGENTPIIRSFINMHESLYYTFINGRIHESNQRGNDC